MSHALLSPSSASRWLVCTKSARLEETFPDTESTYALEGTLAHSLAELMLKMEFKKISEKEYKKELKKIQKHELYQDEMLEYCKDFLELVVETYRHARDNFGKPVIYFEQEFDLSTFIKDGFGTCDVCIIAGKHLIVFDLKYGKGVPVHAEENKQAMLYALGAVLEFEYAYDIEQIEMVICQPRLENISRWSITKNDLYRWANEELTDQAKKAFNGEGEFAPGDHCQFCRAKATCTANHNMQLEIAKYEFAEPALISDEAIPKILDRIKSFEVWIAAVKEYALDLAVKHGKKWDGYKLVEGRSNRKYNDEGVIATKLLEETDLSADDIFITKLIGITEMEKLLGKKRFAGLLNGYLIKPPGKPTLVPESDSRPALNTIEQAQIDFDDMRSDEVIKLLK